MRERVYFFNLKDANSQSKISLCISEKCHNIVYPEMEIMCHDIVYPLKNLERAKGGVDREKSLPVLPLKRPGFDVSRL